MSDPDAQWGRQQDDGWSPSACADDAPEAAPPSPVQMATPQLLELAEAVRGRAWSDRLAPALGAARDAGWDWPKRALAACRLIFDETEDPRSLRDAAADPLKRGAARRGDYASWAAACREALSAGDGSR